MEIDRRALFHSLGGAAAVALMTPDQKADALEHYMEEQLNAAADEPEYPTVADLAARNEDLTRPARNGAGFLFRQGRDGRLRKLEPMPEKPTLEDFFEYRFAPANHVLQSANRALTTGMSEEIILACLLHDVVLNLIRPDHGWWGCATRRALRPGKNGVCDPLPPVLAVFSGRGIRLRVSGKLFPVVWRRLRAGAVSAGDAQVGQESQMVRVSEARDGE